MQKITGQASKDVELSFTLYSSGNEPRPEMPAYIRRTTGDIVIPTSYLDGSGNQKHDAQGECAVLGYDRASSRILIKFVAETKKPANAFRIKRDGESIVIRAGDFVNRFGLLTKPLTFDVFVQRDQHYLILMPR